MFSSVTLPLSRVIGARHCFELDSHFLHRVARYIPFAGWIVLNFPFPQLCGSAVLVPAELHSMVLGSCGSGLPEPYPPIEAQAFGRWYRRHFVLYYFELTKGSAQG
mgnify:CR=1 FL=1